MWLHLLRDHSVRVRLHHTLLFDLEFSVVLFDSWRHFGFVDSSRHMLVHELYYVTQYLTVRLNFLWQTVVSMALSLTVLNRQWARADKSGKACSVRMFNTDVNSLFLTSWNRDTEEVGWNKTRFTMQSPVVIDFIGF